MQNPSVRSPRCQLARAEALLVLAVRQRGTFDEASLRQVVRWLEDLQRVDLEGPPGRLRVLQDAAQCLHAMEPTDLEDWETRAALDSIQEHSSQLIWARSLGRPEFRSGT